MAARARIGVAVTVCLAAAAIACRTAPQPLSTRSFTLDGRAPRVVYVSRETSVPLTLTNTGQHAWDPARVHLSYHWLWLVPREWVSRSRLDVPYHEGIRTDLGQPVPPAARVMVRGRLLPPEFPGVYWLQWDMVEEQITWFSQVSPREPRLLIVVLPDAAGAFAPLPLLAALAGLLAAGRLAPRSAPLAAMGRLPWRPLIVALVATGDVIWCASALFVKQILLGSAASLEPTPVAYWLSVVAAVLPPLVALLLVPRRSRAWLLLGVGVLGSFVMLADVLYYRFFGDVISTPALLAGRQTGHVFGSIASLLSPGLLWLVVDLPFAAWLAISLRRIRPVDWLPRRTAATVIVVSLAIAGLALSAPRELASIPLDQMFRGRSVMEQVGPFGFHAYDAWIYARTTLLRRPPTDAQVADARAWFAGRAAMRSGEGPSFGAARGRNLIVIQVESLQDFAVDYRIDGQEVMPHLRRWIDDSLRFTNITDQTNEGRTSDGEFTALVSLLPLDHGAVVFRYPGDRYVGLPRVLHEHGYTTLSAVPFDPGFWNRRVMHAAYGFTQSLFDRDFAAAEQIGWGLNDRDFLQQMVPRLEALPRPFCAWLITLSLHHPFSGFPSRHKVLKLGVHEGTPFGNYLHTMHFFDDALGAFTSALARDGLLGDSLVIVFGDHDSGFLREPGHARQMGIRSHSLADWALSDRVPFFVRVPGARADSLRGARDVVAGQTDFAPTLLALLGVDPAPLPYIGRNLLGRPDNPPVLRPFGDWLDADRLFISRAAVPTPCYRPATRTFVDVSACADGDQAARKTRDVSRFVITEGLQQRLRAPDAR